MSSEVSYMKVREQTHATLCYTMGGSKVGVGGESSESVVLNVAAATMSRSVIPAQSNWHFIFTTRICLIVLGLVTYYLPFIQLYIVLQRTPIPINRNYHAILRIFL